MGESPVDNQAYTAPRSQLPLPPRRSALGRFWLACIICSIAVPIAAVFLVGSAPDWALALFVLACWVLPVGWILYPELQHGGLSQISPGRALAVSAGFFAATAAIAFVLAVVLGVALSLLEFVRHGT